MEFLTFLFIHANLRKTNRVLENTEKKKVCLLRLYREIPDCPKCAAKEGERAGRRSGQDAERE